MPRKFSRLAFWIIVLVFLQIWSKQTQNICTTSVQRLRRWSDIVQMLYKCPVFCGIDYRIIPENTRRPHDVASMLVHRLRRWPNIKTTPCQRLVSAGIKHCDIAFVSVPLRLKCELSRFHIPDNLIFLYIVHLQITCTCYLCLFIDASDIWPASCTSQIIVVSMLATMKQDLVNRLTKQKTHRAPQWQGLI